MVGHAGALVLDPDGVIAVAATLAGGGAAELQAMARYNAAMMISKARSTALLLNAAHALDHMFLLIFATSVGAIAADFGLLR